MYFVYVIYNKKNDKIYIGQTSNLEERLAIHNSHEFRGSFTSRFDGEWILIYSERAENRQSAIKREKELKSYKGREYIKKFIIK